MIRVLENFQYTGSKVDRQDTVTHCDTRMWADAQRDGRPAEYRWRTLPKFRNYIPCQSRKVWLTPAAVVSCNNAANIGDHKTWT